MLHNTDERAYGLSRNGRYGLRLTGTLRLLLGAYRPTLPPGNALAGTTFLAAVIRAGPRPFAKASMLKCPLI